MPKRKLPACPICGAKMVKSHFGLLRCSRAYTVIRKRKGGEWVWVEDQTIPRDCVYAPISVSAHLALCAKLKGGKVVERGYFHPRCARLCAYGKETMGFCTKKCDEPHKDCRAVEIRLAEGGT